VRRESWRLENLRARLKKNDTSEAVELYGVAREALDYIEDLEREAFEQEKRLDESRKTIDDKDTKISDLEIRLEEFDSEVADAAREVIKLVPAVLGREDVVSESVEAFDLRRAVEDLKTVC
jgi:chromosome segregation ATPase